MASFVRGEFDFDHFLMSINDSGFLAAGALFIWLAVWPSGRQSLEFGQNLLGFDLMRDAVPGG